MTFPDAGEESRRRAKSDSHLLLSLSLLMQPPAQEQVPAEELPALEELPE